MRTKRFAFVAAGLLLLGLAASLQAGSLAESAAAITAPLQDALKRAAADPSPGSIALMVLILAVSPFSLIIPMTASCVLAGALLSSTLGPLVILAGLLLNTILAWSLARTVFGRRLEHWIEARGGMLAQVRTHAREGGFKWTFICRFIPAPFIGTPMVMASAGVPLGPVLAGTALAMVPWSFAYAWAGRAGREGSLKSLGLAALLVLAITGLAFWIRHRYLKPAGPQKPVKAPAVRNSRRQGTVPKKKAVSRIKAKAAR